MKKHVFVALFVISAISLGLSDAQAGGCPGNCNGNGVCDGGTNTCICNVGFVGTGCEFCAPNYYNYPLCTFCDAAITCSGNGTCSATGSCNCNSGYTGVNCENGPPAVPTVSEWGLAVLTLTGLIAGTLLFTRRNSLTKA